MASFYDDDHMKKPTECPVPVDTCKFCILSDCHFRTDKKILDEIGKAELAELSKRGIQYAFRGI